MINERVKCNRSAIEVEDILPIEIWEMETSIERCLDNAKEARAKFDKVNTNIHLPHIYYCIHSFLEGNIFSCACQSVRLEGSSCDNYP